MNPKSVLLFCSGIDEVMADTNKVGGIQVQMMFWGEAFASNGWNVYALSEGKPKANSPTIRFIQVPISRLLSHLHLEIIQDFRWAWCSIRKCKPKVVLSRGASRGLYFLHLLCKAKKIKLVFLGASDSDFVPGKEIVLGNSINRTMYQKGLRKVDYIVTQNHEQHEALKTNYGKDSITIANLWRPSTVGSSSEKKYDVIWVAYLRPLKRAEWFLDLAKQLPQYSFAIAGGVADQQYYNKIEKEAKGIQNLSFLGALSFNGINNLMAQSKLLVCSSEFEGFPNTFLQAWAQSIPVVTTVNPSGVVSKYQLGVVVSNPQDLLEQTSKLLEDATYYAKLQQSIGSYFLESHDCTNAYNKLMDYLHELD